MDYRPEHERVKDVRKNDRLVAYIGDQTYDFIQFNQTLYMNYLRVTDIMTYYAASVHSPLTAMV